MPEQPRHAQGTSSTPVVGADVDALLAARADPRTNTVVSWVLRVGLGVSVVVLVVGLCVQLATGAHQAAAVKMFDLLAPRGVGERIMAIGVLLLMITPACGVLSVLSSFVRERDRRFAVVAAVVVVVLAAAVVVGVA